MQGKNQKNVEESQLERLGNQQINRLAGYNENTYQERVNTTSSNYIMTDPDSEDQNFDKGILL